MSGCIPIFDTALLNAGLVEENKRPRRLKSGEHDAHASVNQRDVRSRKFPRSDFRDNRAFFGRSRRDLCRAQTCS
jgi:hypothetical protein